MSQVILADGLDAMKEALSVGDVMNLIEKTARWVSPETFNLLPLWYPEYARRDFLYKQNWSAPFPNKNRKTGIEVHKQEGNSRANEALTQALGSRKKERPNWTCCHIWGTDDQAYQSSSEVVQDPRFYSCVANMVLLPSPLKAFTDMIPEVKKMLRVCALHTYGWMCHHESVESSASTLSNFDNWDDYPTSWPKTGSDNPPLGTIKTNERIKASIKRRKAQILRDLNGAGEYYPKEQVLSVLEYWKIDLKEKNI